MPWLFFALSLIAVIIAFNTFSIGLAAISLLAALGFGVAGVLKLLGSRISGVSQNPASMLDASAIASIRAKAGKPADGGSATPTPTVSRQPDRNTDGDFDGGGADGGGGGD